MLPTVYNTRCSWHAIQGHTVTYNKPGYSGFKQDRLGGGQTVLKDSGEMPHLTLKCYVMEYQPNVTNELTKNNYTK